MPRRNEPGWSGLCSQTPRQLAAASSTPYRSASRKLTGPASGVRSRGASSRQDCRRARSSSSSWAQSGPSTGSAASRAAASTRVPSSGSSRPAVTPSRPRSSSGRSPARWNRAAGAGPSVSQLCRASRGSCGMTVAWQTVPPACTSEATGRSRACFWKIPYGPSRRNDRAPSSTASRSTDSRYSVGTRCLTEAAYTLVRSGRTCRARQTVVVKQSATSRSRKAPVRTERACGRSVTARW